MSQLLRYAPPVLVTGVALTAEDGDLTVRNADAGAASTSNASPIELEDTPPTVYCTSKLSSAICSAQLATSGPTAQPVSGANGYQLIANGVQEFKNGLFFGSVGGQASIPFVGGTLCMVPPTFRTAIQNSGGSSPTGCNGQMVLTVNDGNPIPFGPDAGPGNTSQMQLWYRDPQNGAGTLGTALSNAVEFTFQ